MPDLLLEVGTEEMPAGAIESALSQLKSAIELGLTAARVPADCVSVCGTPRRLIVTATELPARQPDLSTQVKGPSKSVAFDASGNPTGAAIGFAKKQGIAVEDLTILSTDQGDYVQALVHEVGLPAIEAVSPIITAALKGLSFPKVMRWGNGANRFVRPVRWIVCMIDGKVTDFEFGGVKAGSKSRGHRFLSPDEFELSTGSNFARELYSRHVMIDPEKRREAIVRQSNELAAELGGNIPWDEGLLDENVWLVEWPTAVLGSFDPEYLELPRPVLVTAMKKHQRYFPIEDAGGNLKPNFIAIRSGDDANLDIVRDGYERVLAARFNDAKYFYSQDLESSLPEMRSQLDRLVFQEKLGNYLQKSNRLLSLANFMATSAGVDVASASRTAELCKADLVSRMVIELPALQGVIGREYALKTESPDVADAILEHYLPRFPGDKLPATPVGRLLAIADRIDTLVGYVGIGILPTGSSDPFGLRRAAQGLVQLLLADGPDWKITDLISHSAAGYGDILVSDTGKLRADLLGLLRTRALVLFEEAGIRPDIIDAVLSNIPDENLEAQVALSRAQSLQSCSTRAEFTTVVQAAARVANILKSSKSGGAISDVSDALFADPSESALFESAVSIKQSVTIAAQSRQYDQVFVELATLSPEVDAFFLQVMVMAEDEAVRQNRLALLRLVDDLYRELADFTKIEG